MSQVIKDAAIQLSKLMDNSSNVENDAEAIDSLVLKHSLLAVGAALVPVPGADIAAMTVNVWTMYMRINKELGVKFSENQMKSIGSAVIGNLTSNLIALGAGSVLKFIPGSSLVTGAFLSALAYATNVTSAWVYIRALTKFIAKGSSSSAELQNYVDEVMDCKRELNSVFNEARTSYKPQ